MQTGHYAHRRQFVFGINIQCSWIKIKVSLILFYAFFDRIKQPKARQGHIFHFKLNNFFKFIEQFLENLESDLLTIFKLDNSVVPYK